MKRYSCRRGGPRRREGSNKLQTRDWGNLPLSNSKNSVHVCPIAQGVPNLCWQHVLSVAAGKRKDALQIITNRGALLEVPV